MSSKTLCWRKGGLRKPTSDSSTGDGEHCWIRTHPVTPDGEVDPKRDTLLTVIVKCSDRVGKKYAGCKKVKCDNGARYVYIDFDRMVHYDPED
jgi:hypothetical protein